MGKKQATSPKVVHYGCALTTTFILLILSISCAPVDGEPTNPPKPVADPNTEEIGGVETKCDVEDIKGFRFPPFYKENYLPEVYVYRR